MVFAHIADVNTVVATLSNGRKLVSTTIPVSDANFGATQVTVTPLTRILAYIPSFKNVGAAGATTFAAGTNPNQIVVTPAASINGATIEIISVGV